MKHQIYFIIFVLFALLACGCATKSTGVLMTGPDYYMVTRQEGAFPTGREPLLTDAIDEGRAKCKELNKTFKLLSTYENPGPYILANYPRATVTFSCIKSPL